MTKAHRTPTPIGSPTRRSLRTPSPSAAADAELTWFFNEAEIAMDLPSNFHGPVGGASATSLEEVERRVEALHAARKIQERLASLRPTDALLLAGFYTERSWSRAVARALPGGLAGAARSSPELLAAYTCASRCGETRAKNVADFVEEMVGTAPATVVASWRAKLEAACGTAIGAYERALRRGPSVVVPREDR